MEVSIAEALSGKGAQGAEGPVTIKGWLRTRRDSKGGFSFLHVNDGSCFDSIQVVAPSSLANYASEVLHLTTGCSAIISGKLVKSQGKGQAYEIQADRVQVIGMV
ncbi:MAG TPA: OB-fold nucleic acid binding domain-containing protein, partial [Tepidisphaeraceae bacterium]